MKKKPSDYFETHIHHKNAPVHKIEGTYLGYISIDGVKYWDGRDFNPEDFVFSPLKERLPSDWAHREDLQ